MVKLNQGLLARHSHQILGVAIAVYRNNGVAYLGESQEGDKIYIFSTQTLAESFVENLPSGDAGLQPQYQKMRFGKVIEWLEDDITFVFDEVAFDRFEPLALSIGIPIDDVTAKPSDEGDSGLRWVEFWLD